MTKTGPVKKRHLSLFCLSALTIIFGAAAVFRLSPIFFPITAVDLKQDSLSSIRFYDRGGELLQEVLSVDQSRAVRLPLEEISPYLAGAMVAVEDRRFFRHGGVDWPAVLRASWQNLKAGRVTSGGSTITLQLARIINPAPRTVSNKLKEWHRAWRMEAGMSKKEILEEYLNRLPMGGNLYGVEAAARAYFGLPCRDLSLAQAAYLAGIPNSPTRVNPFRDREALKKRQSFILSRMAALKLVEPQRSGRAAREAIRILPRSVSFAAPHFVFSLLESLPDGAREVRTTIDGHLQRRLDRIVEKSVGALKGLNVNQGAAVLMDNKTGEIIAYIGSKDFLDVSHGGKIDGVRTPRQPGSALKPFLYSLAFEKEFSPASVLPDIPAYYKMPEGTYSPRNYSKVSYGPVRLRTALANSLNVPAVRLTVDIGVEPFLTRLREFGFSSLDKGADHYGAGLVLGDGEVTLLELAGGYMTLARGGSRIPARGVLSVDGRETAPAGEGYHVADAGAVFLVTDILSDRYARAAEFGVNSVLSLPFPCAVKTGTSYRFYDNWAAGFTEDYTLAVWVGNFERTPMQKVSGVSGAGPLFAGIMIDLYRGKDYPGNFELPEGLVELSVCSLSGKRPSAGCPKRIREFIPSDKIDGYWTEKCEYHVKRIVDTRCGKLATGATPEEFVKPEVFVDLPPIYGAWQRKAGLTPPPVEYSTLDDDTSETARAVETDGFRIVRPADGTTYARLPDLDPSYQSIKFELVTPSPGLPVRWSIDGSFLKETVRDHALLWNAVRGEHLLIAEGPRPGMTSKVKFNVR